MTSWNLSYRSLLVAVVVLSNFITWTSSKQPLMHHISDLRNRDKRQGAGLSSSSSYVAHDDTCSLPIEEGSCTGSFHRWGYDTKSQSCKQFIWSGCEGNSNQFKTEAACQMRCSHYTEHSKPPKQEQYITVAQREAIDDKINTKTVTTRKIKKYRTTTTTTSPFSNGCAGFKFGCCYDNKTKALGPDKHGCPCNATEFGCCPDGVTIATSPDQQSCRCQYSTHGCCSDGKTAATGANGAGCDCASSKYGCCPDGQTEAIGSNFLGCVDIPENKQERSTTTKVTTRTELIQPGSRDDKKTTLRCLFHRNVPNNDTSVKKMNINSTDLDVYVCVMDSELGNVTQNINLVVKETINEVLPNCLRKEAECLHLNCEFGIQYYRSEDGCVSCNCSTPEPDCKKEKVECKKLTCKYAIEKIVTANGCERCQCKASNACDHDVVTCLDNEQCVLIAESVDPLTQEVTYYAECRVVSSTIMKPTTLEPITLQSTTLANASTTITTTDSPVSFTVPVSMHLSTTQNTVNIGADLLIVCEVDGYPEPELHWTKDGARIEPDDRISITGTTISKLNISRVLMSDSGRYACHATNSYSSQFLDTEVNVVRKKLTCKYGIEKIVTTNGCERCQCKADNPRDHDVVTCLDNEQCVVIAKSDPLTQEYIYYAECRVVSSTIMKPTTLQSTTLADASTTITTTEIPVTFTGDIDEVSPDCSAYLAECAQLNCEFETQYIRTSDGCNRCQCVTSKIDCEPLREECARLRCNFGMERTVGLNGCERCNCKVEVNPCITANCLDSERCVVVPYRDPHTQEPRYDAECRTVLKPGLCPVDDFFSDGVICEDDCYDDADCRGVGKCCMRGCKKMCVEPAASTLAPTTITTTHTPDLPEPPVALPQPEPDVSWSEGAKATLRCLFHSNPSPRITWRRGKLTINGKVGRYRLTSEGALEIVSLYRNDTGVYICVADNGLGTATQQINLVVTVPVAVHVSASYSTLNIGTALKLACGVDGYPEPNVYWTKDGQTIVPDDRVLISGTTTSRLLISRATVGDSGLYGCHADNGFSSQSDTAQINVQQLTVPAKCTDNPFSVECDLIVRNNFCNHKYYSKYCCKSCVEAGQLDPQVAEAQADQPFRKK